MTSQDATIELKQLIAKDVSAELVLSDGTTRYFHGYVTRFIHLGTDGGLATYSATLRRWVWMLGRRYDIRIFQEKTSEDILKEVFSQYGMIARYEFRLLKSLKPYSYCTQYRESDLNFTKRLFEHDGLFFYFEHTEDGQVRQCTGLQFLRMRLRYALQWPRMMVPMNTGALVAILAFRIRQPVTERAAG